MINNLTPGLFTPLFKKLFSTPFDLGDEIEFVNTGGYDVILLAGQSNMVGEYGPIDSELDAVHPDIFQFGFNSQSVTQAADPLDHVDESAGNIGLGLTLAKAYAASSLTSGRKILLVPVADGGTGFSSGYWQPGGTGYNNAVARCNQAMTQGEGTNKLVMIAWHQGEADRAESQSLYAGWIDNFVSNLRSDLTGATANTPFIFGTIKSTSTQFGAGVDAALRDTTNRIAYSALVETEDLTLGADGVHYNAASLRTMGSRYYTALAVAQSNAPEVPDQVTGLVGTPGDEQISLSWNAPSPNGSPITDYVIQYRETGGGAYSTLADGTSTSTSVVVSGLTNDTQYDFIVSAVNAIGTGASSTVEQATPEADAEPGTEAESGAAYHWLFGTDNPSFEDLVSSAALTDLSTSGPTNAANYVTLPNEFPNALASSMDDTGDEFTLIATIRTTTAQAIILGNLQFPEGDGGFGLYMNNSDFRINMAGLANEKVDDWRTGFLFFAVSFNKVAGTRLTYLRNTADYDASSLGSQPYASPDPAQPLAIGNAYWTSGFHASIDCAEFILFPTAKSLTELHDIYDRSVIRLADRGITL